MNAARGKGAKRPTLEEVERAIAEHVTPLLEADGGSLRVEQVADDGTVFVTLRGRCAGCPGQHYTLSTLVEPAITKKVRGVKRVIAVPWKLPPQR